MKVSELKEQLGRTLQNIDEFTICVVVKQTGSIGATPSVGVKCVDVGFDWDNGKLLIHPDEQVARSSVENVDTIKQLQDKYGWAMYENRNLKAKIKKLKKQIGVKDEQDS